MLHCAYRKKITAGKPQHTNFYSPAYNRYGAIDKHPLDRGAINAPA
jgi:hypothetical protein